MPHVNDCANFGPRRCQADEPLIFHKRVIGRLYLPRTPIEDSFSLPLLELGLRFQRGMGDVVVSFCEDRVETSVGSRGRTRDRVRFVLPIVQTREVSVKISLGRGRRGKGTVSIVKFLGRFAYCIVFSYMGIWINLCDRIIESLKANFIIDFVHI